MVWATQVFWSFTALKSNSRIFSSSLHSSHTVFYSTPLLHSIHWHLVLLQLALWDFKVPTSGSVAAHLRSLFQNNHACQSGQSMTFFSAVCMFFSGLYFPVIFHLSATCRAKHFRHKCQRRILNGDAWVTCRCKEVKPRHQKYRLSQCFPVVLQKLPAADGTGQGGRKHFMGLFLSVLCLRSSRPRSCYLVKKEFPAVRIIPEPGYGLHQSRNPDRM